MDVLTCCTIERNKVGKAWIYSIQTFSILLKKKCRQNRCFISQVHIVMDSIHVQTQIRQSHCIFCTSDLILHGKLSQSLFFHRMQVEKNEDH